jgi:hypothetical protein
MRLLSRLLAATVLAGLPLAATHAQTSPPPVEAASVSGPVLSRDALRTEFTVELLPEDFKDGRLTLDVDVTVEAVSPGSAFSIGTTVSDGRRRRGAGETLFAPPLVAGESRTVKAQVPPDFVGTARPPRLLVTVNLLPAERFGRFEGFEVRITGVRPEGRPPAPPADGPTDGMPMPNPADGSVPAPAVVPEAAPPAPRPAQPAPARQPQPQQQQQRPPAR